MSFYIESNGVCVYVGFLSLSLSLSLSVFHIITILVSGIYINSCISEVSSIVLENK